MYNAALPEMTTRSPRTSHSRRPLRAPPCSALSRVLPRRCAQYGAREVCAEPVTGSSLTPTLGPEPARDEIEALAARGHRHPAARQALQPGEVRRQGGDHLFVVDHHEVIVGLQHFRLGNTQRLQQSVRCRARLRTLGREVHRQRVALAPHAQLTATGSETQYRGSVVELVDQYPGRRQGRMTAQVHLDLRREPAQSIVAVAADDKGGFRKIVLFRDGLQALVVQPGIEGQTAAGLPWKGPVGECVYLEDRQFHVPDSCIDGLRTLAAGPRPGQCRAPRRRLAQI